MIEIRPSALPLNHPAGLLATWFGAGLLRPASGTWGSAAALPFAWIILSVAGPWYLLAAAVFIFAIGCWAADVYEKADENKDPGAVVIDEVAGQWLVLCVAPLEPAAFFAGFILFRIADVLKPWPANLADRHVKGGFGIMLDDVLAALYALAALYSLTLIVENWDVV